LTGPVIAAAAVRLAFLALVLTRKGITGLISSDTASYLDPGRNLLLHGRFISNGLPEINRTPGYPLFLAITSLPGPVFASLAQVVLSVFSVVLVWRLARVVFADDRIALGAAWIFAFEPLSIILSFDLLSDTLFLTLLLLSLERLATFLRGHSLRTLVVAGLWLAAATFVRPMIYYLPFALALGLMSVLARAPRLCWKAPAVLLVSVLPWLGAWQIRNWVETGYNGFSAIAPIDLYFYNAAEVAARAQHRPFKEIQTEFGNESEQAYLARHPEQAGWSQAQRVSFMGSEGARILRRYPGIFLRMHLEGSMRVMFIPATLDWMEMLSDDNKVSIRMQAEAHDVGPVETALRLFRTYPWQSAGLVVLEIVLLGLYLLAVRGLLRRRAPVAILCLLLGVSLYFLAVSGGAEGGGRYRLPIMPLVCMLAAAGALPKMAGAAADSKNAGELPHTPAAKATKTLGKQNENWMLG
jgi:hypothetical protein